ncbi:hypothetical protein N7450_003842 [Penicillium hetheringtonii]|uniref:Uncharacterized protein n=1 Tax=Penicillium hetheringtonii TaxID=911720 RepID=A0AAD6DPQ2_9EURO|nr:hypothetical protein N7450_003842 [Penicillium hetheringtonii]
MEMMGCDGLVSADIRAGCRFGMGRTSIFSSSGTSGLIRRASWWTRRDASFNLPKIQATKLKIFASPPDGSWLFHL